MNAKQAHRISLWANGKWLYHTDTTGIDEAALSVADDIRLSKARDDIALSLIKRSGIPINATLDEALRIAGIEP